MQRSHSKEQPEKEINIITYILKGFILNISNPFIILFWLTSMTWISSQAETGKLFNYVFVFFFGTMLTVFGTDIIKSFIGDKIKTAVTSSLDIATKDDVIIAFGSLSYIGEVKRLIKNMED
jgi:threonine/homoserine/homoserine lactone efflux protein